MVLKSIHSLFLTLIIVRLIWMWSQKELLSRFDNKQWSDVLFHDMASVCSIVIHSMLVGFRGIFECQSLWYRWDSTVTLSMFYCYYSLREGAQVFILRSVSSVRVGSIVMTSIVYNWYWHWYEHHIWICKNFMNFYWIPFIFVFLFYWWWRWWVREELVRICQELMTNMMIFDKDSIYHISNCLTSVGN